MMCTTEINVGRGGDILSVLAQYIDDGDAIIKTPNHCYRWMEETDAPKLQIDGGVYLSEEYPPPNGAVRGQQILAIVLQLEYMPSAGLSRPPEKISASSPDELEHLCVSFGRNPARSF